MNQYQLSLENIFQDSLENLHVQNTDNEVYLNAILVSCVLSWTIKTPNQLTTTK